MTVGDRIKQTRMSRGISQVKLADAAEISKQTLYKYEHNIITNIPSDKIEMIASVLDVSPTYLMGWEKPQMRLYGRVAAGEPLEMIPDVRFLNNEYEQNPDEYFGIEIHGNSMDPDIQDGDIAIVHRQDVAENGSLVIATIDGESATCKTLKILSDGIELIPHNSDYAPFTFTAEQVERMPVRILGKVVETRRDW